MRKPSVVLGVLVAAALAACGGSKPKPAAPVAAAPAAPVEPAPLEAALPPPTPLPPIPSTPAPAPAELIATFSSPAPSSMVGLLAAYIDRVEPGAGVNVTLDAVRGAAAEADIDLRGVDLTRPVRALVLDPTRFRDPIVLVVGVEDEATLAAQVKDRGFRYQLHGGLAAIGKEKALVEAAGFALTTLASSPLPPAPTLDLDVGYLMLHYGSMIEQLAAAAGEDGPPEQRAMTQAFTGALVSLLGQVGHAQVSADITGDRVTGALRLEARAGTTLATFVAGQAPATFEQLAVLPGGPIAMAGRIDFGPLMAAMSDVMEPMMSRMYGSSGPAMLDFFRAWRTIDLGELGATAQLTGGAITMAMLLDVSDPAAVVKLWSDAATAQAKATGAVLKVTSKKLTYKRATLLSLQSSLGAGATDADRKGFEMWGGASMGQSLAVVGKTAIMTMGGDALPPAKALIDRLAAGAKRGRPADAGLRAVVEDALRRRESALMAFDLGGLMAFARKTAPPPPGAEPVTLGVAADAGALTLRLTLPAAQVALTANAQAPASSEADATLAIIEQLADRACQCKDAPCMDKVMAEIAALKEPAGKPTKAQMDRAMAAAGRLSKCFAAVGGGAP